MVSDILNEQRNENLSNFRSACPNVDKMIHYMDCFMTSVSERLLTYHVRAFEENEVYHHGSSINLHFRLCRAGMDYLYRRFYLYIINPRFWLVSCPG